MKRKKALALCLAAIFITAATSGCVKVVKIGEEHLLTGEVEFNAGDNVAEIWESSAIPELESKAVDLKQFLTEASGDLQSLVDQYGKYSMGTSGEINYVVRGTGTAQEINQQSKAGYIAIKLDDYDGPEEIRIQIGPVFKGSAIRDSLDFIKFGDYTNQQEWAAVSQSIHTLIDETIIEAVDVRSLTGKTISFTGAFTATDDTQIIITPIALSAE